MKLMVTIVGELDALNATTGAVLWRFDTALGAGGGGRMGISLW